MATRLYRVRLRGTPDQPATTRLVEAGNPAGARSHVARAYFEVDIPSPLEAARLCAAGVSVEVADGVSVLSM